LTCSETGSQRCRQTGRKRAQGSTCTASSQGVEVAVGGTNSTGGSPYFTLQSDKFLKGKQRHGLTSTQNGDSTCFLYAPTHGLFFDDFKKNKNKERASTYKKYLPRVKYGKGDFGAPRGLPVHEVEKYERYWQVNTTIFKYETDHPEHGTVCQRLAEGTQPQRKSVSLVGHQ
jgi:hypothetical protein